MLGDSLTRVVGMQADALLFAEARKQGFDSLEREDDKYLERFKLFQLEATEFYQVLIKKIRKCSGRPEEPLF